jgi:hypothetical protein
MLLWYELVGRKNKRSQIAKLIIRLAITGKRRRKPKS